MSSGESRSRGWFPHHVPGCYIFLRISNGSDGLSLSSELSVESESDEEEESVLDWTGSALDGAETETRAPRSEGVPCVPLAGPTAGVSSSVSGPEAPEDPRGNPKRRKLSPPRSPSIYSEATAKSATSIPAMVIPHLVSHHRSAASTGPGRSTVD